MRSKHERRPDEPPTQNALVDVVGRFPPPADGQANMTALCACLLATGRMVERINTQPSPNPAQNRTEQAHEQLS
jgi:hypothetical protein